MIPQSHLMGDIVQSMDSPALEFSFGSIPWRAFWMTAVGTLSEGLTL